MLILIKIKILSLHTIVVIGVNLSMYKRSKYFDLSYEVLLKRETTLHLFSFIPSVTVSNRNGTLFHRVHYHV